MKDLKMFVVETLSKESFAVVEIFSNKIHSIHDERSIAESIVDYFNR